MGSSFKATFPLWTSCVRQGQGWHCGEDSWEKICGTECPLLSSYHWSFTRVPSGEVSGKGAVSSGTPRAHYCWGMWQGLCMGREAAVWQDRTHICELLSFFFISFTISDLLCSRVGQNRLHLQIEMSVFSRSGKQRTEDQVGTSVCGLRLATFRS